MAWVLCLNDMRASQVEILEPVARAETEEELRAFLERERVEPYRDDRWGKSYRKGGPLEWFNPPWDHDAHLHFQNAGTEDDWARAARDRYWNQVLSVPEVPQ